MGSDKPKSGDETVTKPDWAEGLKDIYDSVVEEPLPDSFKDLLAKLDTPSSDGNS
ncbi:MAG: NepR family anti-sigma factor [Proteobacteria bacterium]|nr:NepR family anti-sigma factor [Pseudomonadota bacterium]MDA0914744.1 NepR family anti-sigma factor [Pseudomonadota bacterium]